MNHKEVTKMVELEVKDLTNLVGDHMTKLVYSWGDKKYYQSNKMVILESIKCIRRHLLLLSKMIRDMDKEKTE